MATATRKSSNGASHRTMRTTRRSTGRSRTAAAIDLLKADHRQVEKWFGQFEKSRSDEKKAELAHKICQALRVHATIEEEIFYPAFLEATQDKEIHHEAEVEHDGAKKLIAQIEDSRPDDDYYDAKVKVLSEMIKHHVNEEEKRNGMFAEARKADMDLAALGEKLKARKDELMSGGRRGRMAKPTTLAAYQ